MSKEAMKLALEEMKIGNYNSAAERLETALAEQPAQQEPVAYWIPKAEQFCIAEPSGRPFAKAWEPLYKSPPAQRTWVGLSEQERNSLWREIMGWGDPSHDDEDLMKAIEDASRRKNT